MRAAIYCRISQDHTGEALGVTRQLEDCTKAAEAAGWVVTEVYSDNDISASSGKPRPEYRRMLRAIEAGEVEAIVAWAPDRLYRKLADLEELIPLVEQRGVSIKTCRAGDFDLATPLGKMIARILGAVATGEGDVKVDRWKRSIRQRREAGLSPKMGGRLYGYTEDDEIEPTEAAIIRQVAEDIIDGVAFTRVLNTLNAAGHRTSRGNQWRRSSLLQLLQNGRLAGHSTLRGDTLGVGEWPAILSPDTFEALQQALEHRTGATTGRARVALLVGMIVCGKCGAKLVTGQRGKRPDGTTKRIYRCPILPGVESCGGLGADAAAVEEIVEEYARAKLADPRVRARLAALGETTHANLAEIITLEARLAELEAELDQPGVPVAAITRAMDRTAERIARLRDAATQVPVGPLRGDWPSDLARRTKMVRLVVERVTINPGPAVKRAFDPKRVEIDPR